MELQLQKASLYGVRSIVVRAGDFFGPGAGNSWLTQGMIRASDRVRSVFYPGPPAVGHSWAYLPDLAETMARLVECEHPMRDYEVFHFGGHWLERGVEMAEEVCRVRGISSRRIKPFPWWAIKLASPFVNVWAPMPLAPQALIPNCVCPTCARPMSRGAPGAPMEFERRCAYHSVPAAASLDAADSGRGQRFLAFVPVPGFSA